MAKYDLRLKARELRRQGISVKKISKDLGVSKGTASIWVRDIILSVEQLQALKKSMIIGGELGRLKGSLMQKERRLKLIEESKKNGIKTISNLNERELLIAGLALYWGEGAKKTREFSFCNSDPKMIQFLMIWLKKCFNISIDELRCYVGINEIHSNRENIVKEYWSRISGIPLNQFRKSKLKKVKNKKVYDNFNEHYGTFAISVLKPARFHYKVLGLIEGLSEAGSGLVSRGVS